MNREKLKNNRIVRNCYYELRGRVQEKKLRAKIGRTLETFGIDRAKIRDEERLMRDMLRMNRRYGYDFDEYLYYHFYRRPPAERLSFVADWEHLGYTCALNDPKNDRLFDDKWQTYQKYGKYYGREVLFCGKDSDPAEFEAFAERHPRFIVKPLDASVGKGVEILSARDGASARELRGALLKKHGGRFIAEELIRQDPVMAAFHPSSVNTVRIPTIRTDSGVRVFHPFFRIGRHGSVVDNAGAGGIIGAVDAETGVVLAAADEHGHAFTVQPDTGKEIVGFTIPHWDEAVAFVTELAQVTPENRYTGWDCALTENGWVMVEANRRGQFVWQIPLQQGCRAELDGILHGMGLKY